MKRARDPSEDHDHGGDDQPQSVKRARGDVVGSENDDEEASDDDSVQSSSTFPPMTGSEDHDDDVANDNPDYDRLLLDASEEGNYSRVQELLGTGADANAKDSSGYTSLHKACLEGHLEIIRLLIAYGANVDAATISGKVPLHEACAKGDSGIVKLLIESGANIQAKDENDRTPLFNAFRYEHEEVADLLVDNGANLIAGSCHLNTFVHAARHLEIVFLAKGEDELTPSVATFIRDIQEVLDSISVSVLKSCGNLVNEGNPLLQILEVLRSSEFHYGNSVLHLARYLDIIRMMIEQGDNVNVNDKYGRTPLHYASHFGLLEMMKSLVTNGAHLNTKADDGSTPLHEACGPYHSDVEPIKWLIESGASINLEDHSGKTPLHLACLNRHLEKVKFFLSRGASVKETLLRDIASKQNNMDVVYILVRHCPWLVS